MVSLIFHQAVLCRVEKISDIYVICRHVNLSVGLEIVQLHRVYCQ